MTILLQYLVEYAWIFYIACAIGAFIYVLRALAAHRQRGLALFTLERETATSQVVRAGAMVLIFVIIGGAIFVSANFILPGLSIYSETLTPTSGAGVVPPISETSPVPSVTPGIVVPTPTSTERVVSASPTPRQVVTNPPPPTDVPAGSAAGELHIGFGDFAELVSYSLPTTEATSGQPPQLTLTWRALDGRSPTNFLVFTHLRRDDGNIVAQHDGPPANGARPMLEWTPGETIEDFHPMGFVPEFSDYTGPATIAVGLYNPDAPSERVGTSAGGDYVILPVTINVVSQ